jgi:hypothetical protein
MSYFYPDPEYHKAIGMRTRIRKPKRYEKMEHETHQIHEPCDNFFVYFIYFVVKLYYDS